MTIKENDFRKIDLNLLIAFAVLYREQSVSAAADKLHLGQPAVSGVLSRLRTLFDDPLFIRSGHKMQPTARASELHSELLPLLEQLQSALFQQAAFDAQTAKADAGHGGLGRDMADAEANSGADAACARHPPERGGKRSLQRCHTA